MATQTTSNTFKWRYWSWKKIFNRLDIQTRNFVNPLFLLLHLLIRLRQVSMVLYWILHFISLLSQDWNPMVTRSQNFLYVQKKIQALKTFDNRWSTSVGREVFYHSDLALKSILQNSLPFRGFPLLVAGVFFKFLPVNQKGVVMRISKGSYRSLNGWSWEKFQLY